MKKKVAFSLFEEMISLADKKLFEFTINTKLKIEGKADKTLVTDCDQIIDHSLSRRATEAGLKIASEEGRHIRDVVRSGNYITIDPIDGTLGYIEYTNNALQSGNIQNFGKKDLGATSDFCLLLGIVENNIPKFGAVYNYITKEKILISSDPVELLRNNNVRGYKAKNCFYMDQRMGGILEQQVQLMKDVTPVVQAALGLKSIYTIINPHESAITIHRVQSAGLWDVMPAAVAAKAYPEVEIYDDNGNKLECNKLRNFTRQRRNYY